MIIKELRKTFEIELQAFLKQKLKMSTFIKVNRHEINLTVGEASGRIGFRFITKAFGYMLQQEVSLPELSDFYNEISPTYRSNINTNFEMIMNTYQESKFKCFAKNLNGTLDLPRDEKERQEACEWIYIKLKDYYLPRVINLMEMKPEVIQDVIKFPDYYKYPFLTILFIIKKNNIALTDLDLEAILSKRILGSKSFDKALLRDHFSDTKGLI